MSEGSTEKNEEQNIFSQIHRSHNEIDTLINEKILPQDVELMILRKQRNDLLNLFELDYNIKNEYIKLIYKEMLHSMESLECSKKQFETLLRFIDNNIDYETIDNNEKALERIKKCQKEISVATIYVANELGINSLDNSMQSNKFLERNNLLYKKIQEEAKKQSTAEINEAKKRYSEDKPEMYKMLVNTVMSECKSTSDLADELMHKLEEDIKRLSQNTEVLLQMGMSNVDKYLKPIANKLFESN